jgi:hypothetical protein
MGVPELINDEWVHDLALLVDLTACLNELNSKLQGENQLVCVKTFQAKFFL